MHLDADKGGGVVNGFKGWIWKHWISDKWPLSGVRVHLNVTCIFLKRQKIFQYYKVSFFLKHSGWFDLAQKFRGLYVDNEMSTCWRMRAKNWNFEQYKHLIHKLIWLWNTKDHNYGRGLNMYHLELLWTLDGVKWWRPGALWALRVRKSWALSKCVRT